MPSNFERLVFEIIATDKNASAAFDRFRRKVDETSRSVDDNSGKLEKNAKSLDNLGESVGGAFKNLGALSGPSGMGALIGAGVALAPVIATVGVGLAGFGAAAVGIAKPVLDAAQKTGGLRAHMDELDPASKKLAVTVLGLGKQFKGFENSLQPEVLGVFGKGIQIAGHLMKDVQPIAKATGAALGGFLDRIDAEFASGTWRDFFSWMATNVGPDIRLIGDSVIHLVDALPALLRSLQPVALQLLNFVDDAAKLLDVAGRVNLRVQQLGHTADDSGGFLGHLANAAKQAFNEMVPGVRDSQTLQHWLSRLGGTAQSTAVAQAALNKRLVDAHTANADLIHPLNATATGLGVWAVSSNQAKIAAQHETAAVQILTGALNTMSAGLLTGQQDQIAWKQAQQAATQAIKAATHSLDSNRASSLAARSAIIQSTVAALAFANQEVKLHHNTDAASAIIRAQIRYLQDHAGKSRVAKQEIDALRGALHRMQDVGPIHESIFMRGRGTWGIFGKNPVNSGLFNKAEGGIIRGGVPGRDSVPILGMPGEVVVPTNMVNAGAVDHLRGRLPGFAAGGVIPSYDGKARGLRGWTGHNWDATLMLISNSMAAGIAAAVRGAIRAASAAVGALGGPTSASARQAQAYAQSRLNAYGWGVSQMGPLIALWNQESGWNRFARNPSSGAYGIPQALPPGKMGAAANPPTSSAAAQINWGLGYIRGRYGSPAGAEAHERAFNWYDQGGWLPPGPSLSYNGTGRPEPVGRTARGPLLVVEHLHVREAADVDLLARRLAFLDN